MWGVYKTVDKVENIVQNMAEVKNIFLIIRKIENWIEFDEVLADVL